MSLYNEGPEGPIYPTPIVGMVGKLPDAARAAGVGFREPGQAIALVGPFKPSLAGSELEKLRGGLADGLPEPDLASHADALGAIREAVRTGMISSAHDVSEGGLACALAECCIEGGMGARLDLAQVAIDREAALFGEGPGGVVVSGPAQAFSGMPGAVIVGETGGELLEIEGALSVPVADLTAAYEGAIPGAFV